VTVAVKPADTLPDWLKGEAFSGLVSVDGQLIARSVAFSAQRGFSDAVIVDLPLDRSFAGETLAPAGIHLGGERPRTLFNTATFLTHTNWQSGATGRTTLGMSIDVPALYRFLGQAQEGGATPNFNQALLYALVGVGLLLLVIEMVALGNGLALARSITTSVDELFDGTEHVKAGRFAHRIAVRSEDQLGQLASSFNDMTTRIQVLLREQDEKRRLAEELRIARDIQMSLLPQGPFNAPGLTVAALCVPAREVGGDYYDFLPLPDGRVGLLIADVSGKGTSAALYMAELKGLMLSLSRIHTSPRALLIEANHIISQHLDSRSFITMTYAVFDHAARTLTCARAGHCPFVRLPSGAAGERRAEMVVPDGMVLGLNLDGGRRFEQCLQEVTIPLQPGDLFLLFTDGISEAMDGSGDCFGEGRLTAFLEAHAGFAPEAIRDRLVEDVALFVQDQPQHDDLTMIILRVD
jgi:serine phosphatase RsbU (regulator of sigma subunit)